MPELLSQTEPIARKDHNCMAWKWMNGMCDFDRGVFTFSELRAIAKAKANKGKIRKGEKYIRQSLKDSGTIYTFKAIPELHKICLKYEVYQD